MYTILVNNKPYTNIQSYIDAQLVAKDLSRKTKSRVLVMSKKDKPECFYDYGQFVWAIDKNLITVF